MSNSAARPHPALTTRAGRKREDTAQRLAEAERLIDERKTQQALEILQAVLTEAPMNALANCLLAQIAIEVGQPAQAIALLEQAETHGGRRIRARARCSRGEMLRIANRANEALAEFSAVLSQHKTGGADNVTAIAALVGMAHVNRARENHAEALECLDHAAALDPDSIPVLKALARLQFDRCDFVGSANTLRRILVRCQNDASVFNDLGGALTELRRLAEAEQAYRIAVRLDPGATVAMKNLAIVLGETSRTDEAAAILVQVLAQDPTDEVARHTHAALRGTDVPCRASEAYVRETFDAFARRFEDKLVAGLNYQTPQLIAAAVARLLPTPAEQFSVLDAGCGTGLCAPCLKPYAEKLIGVDLSPEMLKQARRREAYDELVEAELTSFLLNHPAEYDLIVAADVLNYFGDLDPVMSVFRAALRDDGLVAFSVERLGDDTPASGPFKLNPHGRFSHSEAYLRRYADTSGLAMLSLEAAILRTEGGRPAHGFIAVLKKSRAT
jgi:predicted TPR repeat methyltransferase